MGEFNETTNLILNEKLTLSPSIFVSNSKTFTTYGIVRDLGFSIQRGKTVDIEQNVDISLKINDFKSTKLLKTHSNSIYLNDSADGYEKNSLDSKTILYHVADSKTYYRYENSQIQVSIHELVPIIKRKCDESLNFKIFNYGKTSLDFKQMFSFSKSQSVSLQLFNKNEIKNNIQSNLLFNVSESVQSKKQTKNENVKMIIAISGVKSDVEITSKSQSLFYSLKKSLQIKYNEKNTIFNFINKNQTIYNHQFKKLSENLFTYVSVNNVDSKNIFTRIKNEQQTNHHHKNKLFFYLQPSKTDNRFFVSKISSIVKEDNFYVLTLKYVEPTPNQFSQGQLYKTKVENNELMIDVGQKKVLIESFDDSSFSFNKETDWVKEYWDSRRGYVYRSNFIGDNQTSFLNLEIHVPLNALNCKLSFDYFVSTEKERDLFIILVDGVKTSKSGDIGWVNLTTNLDRGYHYVEMMYRKDRNQNEYLDKVCVDNIRVTYNPLESYGYRISKPIDLSPIKYYKTSLIEWTYDIDDLSDDSDATVKIDVSLDNGNTWIEVENGKSIQNLILNKNYNQESILLRQRLYSYLNYTPRLKNVLLKVVGQSKPSS